MDRQFGGIGVRWSLCGAIWSETDGCRRHHDLWSASYFQHPAIDLAFAARRPLLPILDGGEIFEYDGPGVGDASF